jgi:hypothetical protein
VNAALVLSLTASISIAFAAGCGPALSTTPPQGMPAPGEPNSGDDGLAIAQAAWEEGALPTIPGAPPQRTSPAARPTRMRDPSAAPRPPGVSVLIEGERLGHDPGIAAGDTFMMVYTAHRYWLYDKSGHELEERPGDEIPAASDFNTLFAPLWAPLDRKGAPNAANVNTRLRFDAADPLACDPNDPLKSRACIREFYDTRVLWDAQRKRFWIESAARNHLWFCTPSPKEPCTDEKFTKTQARRFIAVAVSRTEDPRQGFHRYILVDEYADWPKIALHDRYLLLGHRGNANVYVFDADKLAAGNPDRGPVRVAKLDASSFGGTRFVVPVDHFGPSPGVTYLLGTNGSDRVTPFALVNPDPNRAARPVVVAGPSVSIGERFGAPDNNLVWRNGQLHFTWDQCAPGGDGCAPRRVRIVRMPLRRAEGKMELLASNDPAQGFLSLTIGGREPDDAPSDVLDYEKPALSVNGRGDIVVVYARKGHQTAAEVAPELRYSILYAGEAKPRPGVLLRRGTWAQVPDVDDNVKAGIDLAAAVVDPADDTTVWVSHAASDQSLRWYRQITAAIKP